MLELGRQEVIEVVFLGLLVCHRFLAIKKSDFRLGVGGLCWPPYPCVDTDVLISALLFGGAPGRLINLWKTGRIQPLASQEMIKEVLRVLAYPKLHLSPEEIELLLYEEIPPWFEIIEAPLGNRKVWEDPSDDIFVWCAEAGKADLILSGDEHLLKLRDFNSPIVTSRQFLETIEANS